MSAFSGIPVINLLPIYARDIFQIGSTDYSTVMAASGAGSVIGAVLYASLPKIKNLEN